MQSSISLANSSSTCSNLAFSSSFKAIQRSFQYRSYPRLQAHHSKYLIPHIHLPNKLNKEPILTLVVDNRFNNKCTSCTRSIPCRSTQQLSQSSTAYHSSRSNFLQFFFRQEVRNRHTFVSSKTSQRNHSSITVTTDNHTFHFISVATQSLRQEIFET